MTAQDKSLVLNSQINLLRGLHANNRNKENNSIITHVIQSLIKNWENEIAKICEQDNSIKEIFSLYNPDVTPHYFMENNP